MSISRKIRRKMCIWRWSRRSIVVTTITLLLCYVLPQIVFYKKQAELENPLVNFPQYAGYLPKETKESSKSIKDINNSKFWLKNNVKQNDFVPKNRLVIPKALQNKKNVLQYRYGQNEEELFPVNGASKLEKKANRLVIPAAMKKSSKLDQIRNAKQNLKKKPIVTNKKEFNNLMKDAFRIKAWTLPPIDANLQLIKRLKDTLNLKRQSGNLNNPLSKKSVSKKPAIKKLGSKKSLSNKLNPKRQASKKPAPKKPAPKKPASKKLAPKKPAPKKPAPKKAASKKPGPKKNVPKGKGPKNTVLRKNDPKKSGKKKSVLKKPGLKKPALRKPYFKKPAVKKPASQKTVPKKKSPVRRALKRPI